MKNRVSRLVTQQFFQHMFDPNQTRADRQHNEATEQENMSQARSAVSRDAALQEHKFPEVAQASAPTETFCVRLPDSPPPHPARDAPRQDSR